MKGKRLTALFLTAALCVTPAMSAAAEDVDTTEDIEVEVEEEQSAGESEVTEEENTEETEEIQEGAEAEQEESDAESTGANSTESVEVIQTEVEENSNTDSEEIEESSDTLEDVETEETEESQVTVLSDDSEEEIESEEEEETDELTITVYEDSLNQTINYGDDLEMEFDGVEYNVVKISSVKLDGDSISFTTGNVARGYNSGNYAWLKIWNNSSTSDYFTEGEHSIEVRFSNGVSFSTTYTVHRHSYGDEVITEPTCTEGGYSTKTCTTCGYIKTYSETDALGHSLTKTEEVSATCTTDGTEAYWTCETCGKLFSDEEGTTEISEPVTIGAGHTYDEGTVTTEATCTEEGVMTYTCTVCGETTTEAIEATGHSYESVLTEATCTEGGYTTYTCSVCGDSYTDDETEALGHSEAEAVEENEVEATCTENGSYDSVVYCSVCGEELSRETVTVKATGHNYDDGVVTEKANEGTEGTLTYTCSNCGDTQTESFIYTIEEGAEQTISRGNDLIVISNGTYGNAYKKFTGLVVNDEDVDSSYYTAVEGSVIVTISSDYLDTLETGDYTLTINYEDGSVSTTFTIEEETDVEDEDTSEDETDTDTEEDTDTEVEDENSSEDDTDADVEEDEDTSEDDTAEEDENSTEDEEESEDENVNYFIDTDGNVYIISDNGDGTITTTDEEGNESTYTVTENEDGTYTLTDEEGSAYTVSIDENGIVYLVDSTTQEVMTFIDNDGNEYMITDNGNGTITVTDAEGNESLYTVTENEDGTYTLTDEIGNAYTISMDEDGTVYLVNYTAAGTPNTEDETASEEETEEVGTVTEEETTAEEETEEVGTVTEDSDAVQTGDTTNPGLWIVLMIVSGAVVVGIFGKRKLVG